MRHSYFGRKLSRTKNERRRLLQGLVRALVAHGSMRTTVAKAKTVTRLVEKLITKAKHGTRTDVRVLQRELADKETVMQLQADAATRFAARHSGFTRITRLGMRAGDGSEEALVSFVDGPVTSGTTPKSEPEGQSKKEQKPKTRSAQKPVTKKAGGKTSR